MPPAPAVFSRCSSQPSLSSSAAAIVSPARAIASPTWPFSAEPGCRTTPAAPIAAPTRSEWVSEVSALGADLRVLAGAVEQVDGVDQDGLDRAVGHRLAEGGEVLLAVGRGLPHARRLVEDLDRLGAALDAALDGLGEAAGGGDVGADQHGGALSAPASAPRGAPALPQAR